MRILMMFPYAPLPPPNDLGGTKRNLPFLQENLKRHHVTVLSFGTPDEEQIFRQAFGRVCQEIVFVDRKRPRILNAIEQFWLLATGRSSFRQMYRREMQKRLDDLTAKGSFDIIHCCTQLLGFFRFPSNVPVVSDTHEVTYHLLWRTYKNTRDPFFKLLTYLKYRFGKQEEIEVSGKFDALIATTDRDYEIFRHDLPDQKIVVVNNGVNASFFEQQLVATEPGSLVFTGLMTHYPNEHGILFFLDEVFPHIHTSNPKTRLYVVGAKPSKKILARSSEYVIVTGFVEDVRPYMAKGEIYIIPLLIGGGIRGKALEAMAMKKPIVTTTIGCEGIKLVHEYSALFADSPEDFASAILRLQKETQLRNTLSDAAYRTVTEEYNWNNKGMELDRAYGKVLESRGKP